MIKRVAFSFLLVNTLITRQLIVAAPHFNFSTEDPNGSSSKKYSSSFKIRSRLAQFFKHIHPDQMNQAPTKIKDENMRSLKNFNEYIDAVNQQKSIEGKLLKFYISQKTNHKSKKFYSFNLELPEIQSAKMNEQKAQKLLDNIVNALNTKFNEAQEGTSKKKQKKSNDKFFKPNQQEEDSLKIQTQEERIQRQQQTIKPFQQYRSHKDQLTVQRLKNQINSKYMQTEKQNLEMKLRKSVSFADTATSRPMMWARLSMQESGLYKDYKQILNSLIDPKLIFFSEKMTQYQIQEFKKKLLPGGLDPLTLRNNDYINDVCEQMESFQPPFCFLVDDHYSGDEVPGFFTVPYNFKPKELKFKFEELKAKIQEQQQTYIQYYDYFKELQKQLRQNNNIFVDLKDFKGNKDISEKILMMKRLSRYQLTKPDGKFNKVSYHPTFYPMTKQEYEMTINHYFKSPEFIEENLKKTAILLQRNEKRKVCHLINFKDEDLQNVISRVEAHNQLNYKYGWQDQIMQQKKNRRKEILQNEGL